MKRKVALFFAALLYCPLSFNAQQIPHTVQEHICHVVHEVESQQDAVITTPKPKITLLSSFYQFLRIFIILLSNEKLHNNIKLLNQMLVSLIQTAGKIIETTTAKTGDIVDDSSLIETLDPAVTQEMVRALTLQSRMIMIIKNRPTPDEYDRQDKKDVEAILAGFSGVMQGFFTIVQDPDNKKNVMSGIAGMLGNIIAAGKVIMKQCDLPLDADEQEIMASIASLDNNLKKKLLGTIQQRRQFIRISDTKNIVH